jgi:hypothetical protein
MDAKTGRVTQYPIPETKKGFPVGTLNLELDGDRWTSRPSTPRLAIGLRPRAARQGWQRGFGHGIILPPQSGAIGITADINSPVVPVESAAYDPQ